MRASLVYLSTFTLLTSCTLTDDDHLLKSHNTSPKKTVAAYSHHNLPAPPQEGDSQSVTQTRENVRSTYKQVYQSGSWVTKSVTKQIIE